jgi:hypothetical protein
MGYVVAGYVVVLTILFLYGAQLMWRRRKLTRAVARVSSFGDGAVPARGDDTGADGR